MQYICKNPECDCMFIAEDLYGRKTPETFRYCPECEKKGFTQIRRDNLNNKKVGRILFRKPF